MKEKIKEKLGDWKEKLKDSAKENPKAYACLGCCGFVSFALFIGLIVVLCLPGPEPPGMNVCETPECVTLAQQLLNWRDETVDPCDDFYKYSCGKFIEHTSSYGSLNRQTGIVNGLIKEFLLKNQSTNSKSERAMQHLYRTCKSYDTAPNEYDTTQLKAIYSNLNGIIGKSSVPWPTLTKNWPQKDYDFSDLSGRLATSEEEGIKIDMGLFSLDFTYSQKMVLRPSEVDMWDGQEMATAIGQLIQYNGMDYNQYPIVQDVKDVMQLRIWIQQLLAKRPSDKGYISPFDKFQNLIPKNVLNFDKILKTFTNPNKNTVGILKDRILVSDELVDRAKAIETLLSKISPRTMANYLYMRYYHHARQIINKPKEEECTGIVIDHLPTASIRVFVRNHFDKGNLKVVSDLVETIRENFLKMLEDSTWLSEKTKKSVIKKAKEMKKVIGYPEEFEKEGELDRRFDVSSSYSETFYSLTYKIERYLFTQILEFVTEESPLNPLTISLETNANYAGSANTLAVLAPIIGDPIFHASYPNYAKLAGVGFVLAHEMGHGYDFDGIEHNENGDYGRWWASEDVKEYKNRGKCLINLYTNYNDPDFGKGKLDGKKTIDENVPDLLASDVTWRAFKGLDMEKEQWIVGFEGYSLEKLFFQIGALNWCSARSPRTLKDQQDQSHATASFRVNGVFSNRKEFAEAYSCKVGSPMNPEKKCELF